MKILAVTPVWRTLPQIRAAQQAMLDASPVPVDWWRTERQSFAPPDHRNIAATYNAAVMRARAGGYTHLLTLEDDMLTPADTLAKLLSCDVPVVYSLYCWRWGKHLWSAYRMVMDDGGASWSDDEPHTAAGMLRSGGVHPVAGLGCGCTLIDLKVFDRLSWRVNIGDRTAQDWWFALDCQRHKIPQVAHFGATVGHAHEQHGVIWPDADGDTVQRTMYRYEAL